MRTYFSHKKRQRIGAAKVLLIQSIVGVAILVFFWKNYHHFAVSEGIVQPSFLSGEEFFSGIERPIILQQDNTVKYEGVFGSFTHTVKQKTGSLFTMVRKTIDNISLKQDVLYTYHAILELLPKNYINTKTALFLMKFPDPLRALQDLVFLRIIPGEALPDFRILDPYKVLLEERKYSHLATTLENLESIVVALLRKQRTQESVFSDPFFSHHNFAYIYQTFLVDPKDFYRSHIANVAKILDIDPTLIRAAIMTEQVRGFFTYKGVAERILGDAFGIMSMGQGSYGIGGVKVETAQRAENWLKKNYPDIFHQYFGTLSSPEVIQKRLQDHTNYRYQILYVGMILKKIVSTRKEAGYDITYNPGVTLTLYNIGDEKKPHAKPYVGGAAINVLGQTYSFGELGMKLWYWLKIENNL